MGVRTRLARLERRDPSAPPEGSAPLVECWMPDNGRGGPPGGYLCPDSNVVLVIYQDDEPAPGEADT